CATPAPSRCCSSGAATTPTRPSTPRSPSPPTCTGQDLQLAVLPADRHGVRELALELAGLVEVVEGEQDRLPGTVLDDPPAVEGVAGERAGGGGVGRALRGVGG